MLPMVVQALVLAAVGSETLTAPVVYRLMSEFAPTPRGVVRVPVSGGSVAVIGRGFGDNSASATCRLHVAGAECGALEEQHWAQYMTRAISFDKPDPGNYSRLATIVNDTHLTCSVPPVVSAGFAGLQVSVSEGLWSTPNPSSCIKMFPAFSAAVSRRPYFQESQGAVLVRIDPSLPTKGLVVSAFLNTPTPIKLLDQKPCIGGGLRQRLAFSLSSLPPVINTSIDIIVHLPANNVTFKQSRAFVRHYQPPLYPVGSTSAIDFETSSVLVNGNSWMVSGVYVLSGNMLVGEDTLLPSNRLHQPGFEEKIERLARGGLTTLLVYNLNLWPIEKRAAFMADMDTIGVKVLCPLWGPAVGSVGADLDLSAFISLVTELRQYRALLGYYICDDCTGMASRTNHSLSNWDSNMLLARYYRLLKATDPWHITVGAVQTSDLWSFSDSTGLLSVDLPLVENYGGGLAAHAAGDSRFVRWPMDWTPVINCGWGEAMTYHTYAGTITPEQLRADAYTAIIAGMTAGQLWFGLQENTEPALVAAMMGVSRELQEMAPALAPSTQQAMAPTVTVAAVSTLSGAAIAPDPVIARAWSESVASGASEQSFCVWVVAVNRSPDPVIADLLFRSDTGLMETVPPTAGLSIPFAPVFIDPAGQKTVRTIPLRMTNASSMNGGTGRFFSDVILGGSSVVYQLGCQLPELPARNLVDNPSFEEFVVAGSPAGWALVPGNDGRDRRASMSLDLIRPLHGRHSLRVVVPSIEPLVVPFSLPYNGAFGFPLMPEKSYAVEIWARSEPTGKDSSSGNKVLTLEVMNGTWTNAASDWAHTGESHMKFAGHRNGPVHKLSADWISIRATVSSDHASSSLHLQLGGGPGVVWLDNSSVVLLSH